MFASRSNCARATSTLCALLCGLFLAGCAVPLAPGYQVQKESLSVRFVPGAPPHLAIRADYRLQNIGTAPLNFVEVALPSAHNFGLANLRAIVSGKEIAVEPEQNAEDDATPSQILYRIPIPGSLRRKQKSAVTLEYDLAATQTSDRRIFVASNMFYLNDSGWFPEFQEPKAFFAEDITRPNPTDLLIMVPVSFLATAAGQERGTKKREGALEFRFRIRSADFNPYVVAGAYNEQRVSTSNGTVVIWSPNPVSSAQARQIVVQITAAKEFYVQNFGPLPDPSKPLYDLEAPGAFAANGLGSLLHYGPFLPGAVQNWAPSDSNAQANADANTNIPNAEIELAQTWFAHVIAPKPEAWLLSDGLTFYAATLARHSASLQSTKFIQSTLAEYGRQRVGGSEKPLNSLAAADPFDALQSGEIKMRLFLFALGDKCGAQNLTHAMSHMVYALRGQQYGYSDFRAALEQECHQNLGGFFRTWLNQTGIPADFRARYENGNAPLKQKSIIYRRNREGSHFYGPRPQGNWPIFAGHPRQRLRFHLRTGRL